MRKIFLSLLVIYSLVLTSACPVAKKSIEQIKNGNSTIASVSNEVANFTRDMYHSGKISLERKDQISDAFIALSTVGVAFDQLVDNLQKTYGSNAPKAELEKLFEFFDDNVVEKFIDAYALIRQTPRPDKLGQLVELIKDAILLIAKVFNRQSTVAGEISTVR